MKNTSIHDNGGVDNIRADDDDDDAAANGSVQPTPTTTTSTATTTMIKVGGDRRPLNKKVQLCYALLDGIHEDPESGLQERVTIPITQLPAILGRSHDTNDPHFFGLGKKKALSRKHCTIYYRDTQGGRVEWNDTMNQLQYESNPEKEFINENLKVNPMTIEDKNNNKKKMNSSNHDDDDEEEEDSFPSNGFFVIECIGKNRILVDKERIEQGESIVLHSGSAIRISSYMLYFLLPTDVVPQHHVIPIDGSSSISTPTSTNPKKRKLMKMGGGPSMVPSFAGSLSSSAAIASTSKKSKLIMGPNFQNELDEMPVNALIEMMDHAFQEGQWERKHQLIGSTIAVYAVQSAGTSKELYSASCDSGVSRSEIMDWIENSTQYGQWVRQMLENMEPRSYQAAITKSLLKAGFVRTGGSGRYVKWQLPPDLRRKVSSTTTTTAATSKSTTGKGNNVSSKKQQPQQRRRLAVGMGGENENENDDDDEIDSEDEPLSKTKRRSDMNDNHRKKRIILKMNHQKSTRKEDNAVDDDEKEEVVEEEDLDEGEGEGEQDDYGDDDDQEEDDEEEEEEEEGGEEELAHKGDSEDGGEEEMDEEENDNVEDGNDDEDGKEEEEANDGSDDDAIGGDGDDHDDNDDDDDDD